MTKKRTAIALAVLAPTATALAVGWQSQSGYMPYAQIGDELYEAEFAHLTPPPDWDGDFMEALAAHATGQTLPDGWSFEESLGSVGVRRTGAFDPDTGESEVSVTVLDDSDDVQQARFLIDGQVVAIATRGNGSIIDRSGVAYANMRAFVNLNLLSFSMRVEWDDAEGDTQAHDVLMGH